MVPVTTDLLIDQWRNSRTVTGLVQAFLTRVEEEVEKPLERLKEMLCIDDAEGVWLDRIGERLGLRRPQVQFSGDRFGFDGAGEAFDQAPFSGIQEEANIVPMADTLYRKLIKARRRALFSDGTEYALTCSICEIDPTAKVIEVGPMQIQVTTSMKPLLVLADKLGALSRNAGVQVTYKDTGRFGFDQAGVAFDQGPYEVA